MRQQLVLAVQALCGHDSLSTNCILSRFFLQLLRSLKNEALVLVQAIVLDKLFFFFCPELALLILQYCKTLEQTVIFGSVFTIRRETVLTCGDDDLLKWFFIFKSKTSVGICVGFKPRIYSAFGLNSCSAALTVLEIRAS